MRFEHELVLSGAVVDAVRLVSACDRRALADRCTQAVSDAFCAPHGRCACKPGSRPVSRTACVVVATFVVRLFNKSPSSLTFFVSTPPAAVGAPVWRMTLEYDGSRTVDVSSRPTVSLQVSNEVP